MTFPIHTTESAPHAALPSLESAQKAFGMIPNLLGTLAEAPGVLKSYLDLSQEFEKSSDLNATERQVVLLTASFENNCTYCMAAHSAIAQSQDVPREVVEALRSGNPIRDAKLEALRTFTQKVVNQRGFVAPEGVAEFLAGGFQPRHVLEVIHGVALKTISNYTNHLANTKLDPAFQKFEWQKPEA